MRKQNITWLKRLGNEKLSWLFFVLLSVSMLNESKAQLAECKDKYLGNIVGGYVPSNYTELWNGVTAENDCKWGVIERNRDQMNWAGADRAYRLAEQNGYEFRWHAIAWGSQYPTWFEGLSESESKAEIIEYMEAVANRYPNIDQIDVLNENLNFGDGRPHASGTPFFRNQLGGAGSTGYDWVVWLFTEARRIFPNSKLIINDYGLVNDPNAIRQQLAIIKVLTDRGLVDGFGSQSHEFNINTLSANNLKSNLDLMATGGIPLYITELDISGDDQTQLERYQRLFPVYWNHPNVAGISIWGYVYGETWIDDTGLIRNGQDRPAMTWLRQYMAALPDVCNVEGAPEVEITSPENNATFDVDANITLEASAIDNDGSVTKVDFYANGNLIGSDNAAPYTFDWLNVAGGTYRITAKATDNEGKEATSEAITISVLGNIVIYANATDGTEILELIVDGEVLTTWNLTEGWSYYTFTGPSTGIFQINYTNDAEGRDVQLDYLEVDGVRYEAEDQQVNTGSYGNGACGGGEYTEYMYCSGYVEFEITAPDADNDGTPDSEDACPNDPEKAEDAGVCGCGNIDEDLDNDDVCDAEDDFIDVDEDGIAQENDCDDTDDTVGEATVWYEDLDNDGYGDSFSTITSCNQPEGYVAIAGDECADDPNKTEPGNCGCDVTEDSCLDCAGVANGDAEVDVCGTCAGGTTGLVAVTDPEACITGATEILDMAAMSIYPNPTSGVVNITQSTAWELYSAHGQFIKEGNTDAVDLSSQASGIYILKAEGKIFKVIKE